MPQKVALYIRVSTQEQAQEGYSIDAQTDRLQAYCKAKDWIVFGTYTDAGFSGSNTKRPALQRLLNDVRAGLVDCVLVYKLDRLSRSQKDTLMLIEDEFLSRDVAFVSMSENFDTSTPLGRAMVGILSVFAQLEREQIKERMCMGRAERAKNGYWHGGGAPPFGYTYSTNDGMLHVEPVEAEIVKEIYALFLQRSTITFIYTSLSKKYGRKITHSMVYSVLSTPIYAGIIQWEGHEYPGLHEALIDKTTFDKVQRWLADRRRLAESKPNPFKPRHLLNGLLYCGHCGARYNTKGNYSGHGDKKKYRPYYTCYSRAKTNKKMIVDPSCRNPSYACVDLDALIIDEVTKLAHDQAAFLRVVNSKKQSPAIPESKKDTLMRRIDELDAQIRRVLDLYQLGSISMDEIKSRVEKLETERDALAAQLEEDEAVKSSVLPPHVAKSLLQDFVSIVDSGDFAVIRDALFELIQRIDVLPEKGQLQIIWNF
jgi:site-specific DNA recombinase